MLVQAMIVTTRWNVSSFMNAPLKMVISATKPLSPGSPRFARPAMTYPTARKGMTFIRPLSSRMSRVCVRP